MRAVLRHSAASVTRLEKDVVEIDSVHEGIATEENEDVDAQQPNWKFSSHKNKTSRKAAAAGNCAPLSHAYKGYNGFKFICVLWSLSQASP